MRSSLAVGGCVVFSLGLGTVEGQALVQADPGVTLDAPVVSDLQEILVDLRIGRLAGRTVRALTDGGEVYLPVSDLLEMSEIDHTVSERGVLRAVLHPGARAVVLEADAGTAAVDDRGVEVSAGDLAIDQRTLFVRRSLIERLFDLTIRTDWTDLTAVVMDPERTPLGRRVAREARWRTLTGEAASGAPSRRVPMEQRSLGGAVVDWSLSSNARDPSGSAAYAVGAGGRLWGGGLQVSARSVGPFGMGAHRVDASYQTVWRDRSWLTQMRLGDGFSTGPRIRSMRGVSLTNAPFTRESFFGVDSFTGRVGPGWDVELRQADRTVDLSRSDEQGAFALDIPLRYGENAVQVVAFGPHGEVVTTERLILLGADRLPSGRFEWGLSGGACRDDRCEATGNLDLRYGLSDRWTVRGGAEGFVRDSVPSLLQPYLSLTGMPLPGLQLASEAVHDGLLRGGLTYAPSPRMRVRGAFTAFSTSVTEPVLHGGRRRSTTEADLMVRPLAGLPQWLVRASFLHQKLDVGTLSTLQAASTVRLGNADVELGVRRETNYAGVGPTSTRDVQLASMTGHLPFPSRGRLWGRAEVELVDASALREVRGRVAYQLGRSTRLEVGSGWRRDTGADLTLTLSADLGGLQSLIQLVAHQGAPSRVTQVSRGAVTWNEATEQVSFSGGPGLERGGISGYVFVDENGNGVRDPAERGLDDVRVVVGGRTVRTDAEGRHEAWDLAPYEPVRVWADSTSIADPRLVPVRNEVEVVVPPSSFGRLDIPVTPSREIWGRVVRVTPHGEVPLPHAALELLELETGAVRSVRAFSDGEFYAAGVKPGRYELRVDEGFLRGLDVTPEREAVVLDVEAGRDAGGVGDIVIRLRRETGREGG